MRIVINAHDYVLVTLTPKGAEIVNRSGYFGRETITGPGPIRIMLWSLMSIFGPEMKMGQEPFFERNDIQLLTKE